MTISPFLSQVPCSTLRGVGPKLSQLLANYGLHSVQDILLHLPLRYQDRTRLTTIAELRAGDLAVIEGRIESVEVKPGKRPMLSCYLNDESGLMLIRFFHFNRSQKEQLKPGLNLRCIGEVKEWSNMMEMVHPEYSILTEDTKFIEASSGLDRLTPIYPSTAGLSQKVFRQLTEQALKFLNASIKLKEYFPENVLNDLNLPHLAEAIAYLHRPPTDADTSLLMEVRHPSQLRLILEELVVYQLNMRRSRLLAQQQSAPIFSKKQGLAEKFLENLSFTLTKAQQRVVKEINHDLTRSQPMLRLVQGDVGSGKTVIAALAALQAVDNGYQAALMAPTELLAEQHYQNFLRWLQPLGIHITFLAAKLTKSAVSIALEEISSGRAQIIIGTHAIFQPQVNFPALGLVIIDEQHRFGVQQRLSLREKGKQENQVPHQLIMTATPIPRTLAMVAYADLDHSIIDELPPGRTPIITSVIPSSRREEIIERIREVCAQKRQVYWVCTLIEESEVLQCQAAETTATYLQSCLPELKVGLLHGRIKTAESEQIMQAFKSGEIDLLVATTVIEVGVDVPNASLMVIENAERLGLAQLHQLRGRVGRGSHTSHCVLLYHYPLSPQAKQRLSVMREHTDGFAIAEHDLAIRGPGEVLGTRQAGMMQFRIADLIRDEHLVDKAQEIATLIQNTSSEISQAIISRWFNRKESYVDV